MPRRQLSLRARMVALTMTIVVMVLLVGGAVLVRFIRAELVENVVDGATLYAGQVAQLAEEGRLPKPITVVGRVEAVVQVVSGRQVLAASEGADEAGVFDLPQVLPGQEEVLTVTEPLPVEETAPYRVAVRGVQTSTGPVTVFVVASIEDVDETAAAVVRVGLTGLPVLVAVLGGVMWLVIGRTLAPVEAIRSEASAITGLRLDRRVPEPVHDDEVGRLARTINAMLGRLQDSAERQRRFVADAAHELRTPVASLRAQLEAALESGSTAGQVALNQDLLHETERMQRLVDQLLLLARADAGTVTSRREAVDLDDVVDAALPPSGVRPEVQIDRLEVEPVQVTGDPDMLEQVVRNLLDNAVRHAERSVRVALTAEAGWALLTVDDDGPGIPVERRGELFDRFVRLDTPRDRGSGGAGVGLAIVADVVKAHGGTVVVLGSALGGARFRVALPVG